MSYTPPDEEALFDVYDSARAIVDFASDMDRESLAHDRRTWSAILREITVIGEATKRLSAEFRAAHPDKAWSRMAGMRDVTVHGYDIIDFDEVWDVAHRDASNLVGYLEPLLPHPFED
ncbi:MAG TPA: HepT-like ribonuclease domain-containing protein [Dehalococcoidia bacterium]